MIAPITNASIDADHPAVTRAFTNSAASTVSIPAPRTTTLPARRASGKPEPKGETFFTRTERVCVGTLGTRHGLEVRLISRYQDRFRARASGLLLTLEGRLDRLMQGWLLLAGLACAVRIAFNPLHGTPDAATLIPYALLILAPFASMVLAMRWFAEGEKMPQPKTRLARVGRWRNVNLSEARQHALFGASGIMVSLLLGILLNVPVRALEFLASMPPLIGAIPSWLWTLSILMTADVVIFTSLYTVAFVAALRRAPIFPRLLASIWVADIAMQVVTAKIAAAAPGIPSSIASALSDLLGGNLQKVLISAAIWLPYLLLSKRVNVTYRKRVAL